MIEGHLASDAGCFTDAYDLWVRVPSAATHVG